MSKIHKQNFVEENRDNFVAEFSTKIRDGAKVLDVGAGHGPYRELFAHCQYLTQDFCQLDETAQRGGKGYAQIDVVSDIVKIPLESNSIDAIICTEVFEHVPDPIAAIKEFSRLLKPGGKVLITAPLCSFLHQEPFHFYGGFTPFFYELHLGNNGFDNIYTEFNHKYFSFIAFDLLRFYKMYMKLPILLIIVLFPFVIATFPITGVLYVFRDFLDKFDKSKRYTFALNVTAIKK